MSVIQQLSIEVDDGPERLPLGKFRLLDGTLLT